jgi:hypothetical protein
LAAPVLFIASEGDPACVPASGEQPMITNPVPIKVASRAEIVLGNLRMSMLVSIGFESLREATAILPESRKHKVWCQAVAGAVKFRHAVPQQDASSCHFTMSSCFGNVVPDRLFVTEWAICDWTIE